MSYLQQRPELQHHLEHHRFSERDDRDYKIVFRLGQKKVPDKTVSPSPSSVVIANLPDIFDQGSLGSCTANASASMIMTIEPVESRTVKSRLFLYYVTRYLQNTVYQDSGASLRTTMNALRKYGICPEDDHPYVVLKFRDKPSPKAYEDALLERATVYSSVGPNLAAMQQCLNSGYAFVFGMIVYSSFVSNSVAADGMVPIPNKRRERKVGGHALLCIGYDIQMHCFIVRNSWGKNWGVQGNCFIPFRVMTDPDLVLERWVVTKSTMSSVYSIVKP